MLGTTGTYLPKLVQLEQVSIAQSLQFSSTTLHCQAIPLSLPTHLTRQSDFDKAPQTAPVD